MWKYKRKFSNFFFLLWLIFRKKFSLHFFCFFRPFFPFILVKKTYFRNRVKYHSCWFFSLKLLFYFSLFIFSIDLLWKISPFYDSIQIILTCCWPFFPLHFPMALFKINLNLLIMLHGIRLIPPWISFLKKSTSIVKVSIKWAPILMDVLGIFEKCQELASIIVWNDKAFLNFI